MSASKYDYGSPTSDWVGRLVEFPSIDHWGIVVAVEDDGEFYMIHKTTEGVVAKDNVREYVKRHRIHRGSDTTQGYGYRIHNHSDKKYKPLSTTETVERAESQLGTTHKSSSNNNNSKDFAEFCRYGERGFFDMMKYANQFGHERPKRDWVGSLVEFPGLISHWGVIVAVDDDNKAYMIHQTKEDGIEKTSVQDYVDSRKDSSGSGRMKSSGRGYRINNLHDHKYKPFSPAEIVKRAESRLHEKNYQLLSNNCEHFANWCRYGKSMSYQLDVRADETGLTCRYYLFKDEELEWGVKLNAGVSCTVNVDEIDIGLTLNATPLPSRSMPPLFSLDTGFKADSNGASVSVLGVTFWLS